MNSHARRLNRKMQPTWISSGASTKAMSTSSTYLCLTPRTLGPERCYGVAWASFNKPRFQICFPILESAYSSQTMPGPWLHSKYVCWMSWHSMGLAQFQPVKHIPTPVTHVGRSVYWAPLPEGAEGIELDVLNDNAAVQERCDRGNDSGAAGFCQRCPGLAC